MALQQEGFRILRNKVAAALGGPAWQQWEVESAVQEVTREDVDGIPGLPRGPGREAAASCFFSCFFAFLALLRFFLF